MSNARIILKNIVFLFNAEVINRVFSLILIIALSRFLGDSGFGKYSFAFAFVCFFILFADFGLTTFVVREVAKDKNKTEKYFNNLIGLKLALLLAGFFLSVLTIVFIEKSIEIILIVALASIASFGESLMMTFGTMFVSHEKMQYSSWTTILERVIALVLGISALVLGYGLKIFILTIIFARFISFLFMYRIIRKKFIKPKLEFNFRFWGYLLKSSMPFCFTKWFTIIFNKTDTLMLSFMTSYATVGWYNAAIKLVEALYFIPGIITLAVFPAMSKFYLQSKNLLRMLYEKSFYYILAISIPSCIGVTLLAERIILFFYRQQFTNSILALKILIWVVIFGFVNSIMGYLLNSINRQKLFTLSCGTCALLNVILNFILILKYSYIGAAIATLISQAANFIMLYYFTSKYGFRLNPIKLITKPIIAGAGMGLSIIYLKNLHLLALIPSAVIVYFAVLFLIKGIGRDEIKLVKSMVYDKLLYKSEKRI